MSAAPQMKSVLKYKMIFQRGSLAGQSFVFDKALVQIGRGSENDLVLVNDPRASRHHAEIRWDGEHLKIINTSTKNFLVINGAQEESAILENGAVVGIGESEFRIDFAGSESAVPFDEGKTKLIVVESPPPFVPSTTSFLQPTSPMPMSIPTPMPAPMAVPASMHQGVSPAARPMPPPASGSIPAPALGAANFGAPQSRRSGPPPSNASLMSNPKVRFYAIIAVVGLALFWLFNSSGVKKKELTFRSTEQIEKDIESSREEIKEFEARKDKMDNVQYRRAQENYIRGFRDYKQGNYGRARESFQVVLNLDPDNDLAKRYYHLSKIKFDEMVKFHMLQGNRYREKKNWRMCRASYFNVMTMVNNGQDPLFKEAKQYFEQCTLAQQGTY